MVSWICRMESASRNVSNCMVLSICQCGRFLCVQTPYRTAIGTVFFMKIGVLAIASYYCKVTAFQSYTQGYAAFSKGRRCAFLGTLRLTLLCAAGARYTYLVPFGCRRMTTRAASSPKSSVSQTSTARLFFLWGFDTPQEKHIVADLVAATLTGWLPLLFD